MTNLIGIVHLVVCFILIVIVLLQNGKGADAGAAFGGGQQAVFGARGAASFLSKLTTSAAIVFMITSLSLAYFSAQTSGSSVFNGADSKAASSIETTAEDTGLDASKAVDEAVANTVEGAEDVPAVSENPLEPKNKVSE